MTVRHVYRRLQSELAALIHCIVTSAPLKRRERSLLLLRLLDGIPRRLPAVPERRLA